MLKTCRISGAVEVRGNTLTVTTPSVYGRPPRIERYEIIPKAQALTNAYSEMVQGAGLKCSPKFVAVRSAKGAGGFHLSGIVVVGDDDAREIATEIWRVEAPTIQFRD